jgi:hypothetical protein
MRRRPEPGGYTPGYVEARFEEAGRTLMALPWTGCFPCGLTCLWPEVADNAPRRYDVPLTRSITEMDETYRWISLITDPDPQQLMAMRRLVLMRSLIFPDSPASDPKYKYTWRALQRMTGLHRDTLMDRWGRGIDRIVGRMNRPGLCARSGGQIHPGPAIVAGWLRSRETVEA